MRAVIDRFEGENAVIETYEGNHVIIPKKDIAPCAKEGDIIESADEKWYVLGKESSIKRKDMAKRLKRLIGGEEE